MYNMKLGSKRKHGSKRHRQRGGELTDQDKIDLMDALKNPFFDGTVLDETKINYIITELNTLSDFYTKDVDEFIYQIIDRFESAEKFNDWFDKVLKDFKDKDTKMEIDTDVLEDNTIDIKSKLNGGKKRRKTRKNRIRKRKTRRLKR